MKAKKFLTSNLNVIIPFALMALLPLTQFNIKAFVLNLIIYCFIYICLAQSWNILAGFCGLLSMGHCAFYGLGVYITILAIGVWDLNLPTAILINVAVNIALAYLVGAISIRVRDIFFAMVTLALAQLLYNLAMQWVEVTRGPRGLIMPPVYTLDRESLYYIALAMTVAFLIVVAVIRKSRMGTMLLALRENEVLAKSLGVDTAKWKIIATIISAVLAALIGTYYALYIRSVQPGSVFSFNVTMKIMIVCFVGGRGTVKGPLLGAIIIVVDELIRGWLGGTYAGLPGIVFGIILALTIFFAPDGLIGIFKQGNKKQEQGVLAK